MNRWGQGFVRAALVLGVISAAAGRTLAGPGCTTNAQCHNDNNSCTCDICDAGTCRHQPTIFGNANCDAALLVTVDDILCVLNGFSSFASCPNGDTHPGCTGNNIINIDDILRILNAFARVDPCGCGSGIPCTTDPQCDDGLFCNGVEHCVAGFCAEGPDPCPGQTCSEAGDVCTGAGTAVMTCQLSSTSAPRGSTVALDVFVESVTNLRAYQTTVEITKLNGPGTLAPDCPSGVTIIESRPDFVFAGHSPVFSAADCDNLRVASALLSGGVNVGPERKYLGTYTLEVSMSSSSCTEYSIQVLPTPDSRLRDPAGNNIPFVIGLPCELQVTGNSGVDCNSNSIPDECEPDCQPNGIADECDLSGGSLDCDGNLVPDECQLDCQPNGVPDVCDLSGGTSLDCNNNDIPDECDANDCQPNGIPDDCDISSLSSTDCNANSVPDECDLAGGNGSDCQPNGVYDLCDIQNATSLDINGNGTPDECEVLCPNNCFDANVCTCDRCISGTCSNTPRGYGDVNCTGGPVNLDDILCTLAGFSDVGSCRNADIAPPCTGNGIINLDDILRVLAAFSGTLPCGCP